MTKEEKVPMLTTATENFISIAGAVMSVAGECKAGITTGASAEEWQAKKVELKDQAARLASFSAWLSSVAETLDNDDELWPNFLPV